MSARFGGYRDVATPALLSGWESAQTFVRGNEGEPQTGQF